MRLPAGRRLRILLGSAVALVAIVAIASVLWLTSGAHEVPLSTAARRFQHEAHGQPGSSGAGRPPSGVYSYRGSGTESLSFPPKTQHEGPLIPGTLTYGAKGCWTLRMDFNDHHWQSTTYCPSGRGLLEPGRGGFYRWNLLALSLADTSRFTCTPPELAVPDGSPPGRRFHFSCTGTNRPLEIPKVTLSGWVRSTAAAAVRVHGTEVPAVHVLEVARFSGGQTGTEMESTWFALGDALPLAGTWSTDVRTPTPIGATTLDASGRFALAALSPTR